MAWEAEDSYSILPPGYAKSLLLCVAELRTGAAEDILTGGLGRKATSPLLLPSMGICWLMQGLGMW